MKMLTRLATALLMCLIAIPMMATPAQAAGTFSISGGSVLHDEGYVGDEINIDGSWDTAHGSYIYIYYELYNEDKDDWDYEKVRYDYAEYDGAEVTGYYFDCDFEIPESCMGVHDILICDDDDPDDDVDTIEFTVYPFIEIDEEDGPAGTEVGVSGKGWDEDESEIEIRFYLKDPGTAHLDDDDYYDVVASQDIEVNDYGSWEDVTFTVPPSSKGAHWIYAVGDEANDIEDDEIKGAEFEVLPGISLDPKQGGVGDSITVVGSGFGEDEEDIEILFDDETVERNIEADEDGCWEETFEVPEAAGGKYDVTAEGEYTDKEDIEEVEFEVLPGLTLSPTEGHVGTSLSVRGSGLSANTSVSVTYDGSQEATGTTDDKGSFTVTFSVPASKYGDHTITANGITRTFVMESDPPPKPILSLPANDSRIGFVGSQTVTLQWQAVDDPSKPVSYSLQISSSPDFSVTPILDETGLSQASYTLTQARALPYGTYYWRVKAADGAENESGWTATYSFRSSLLPLWVFIVIIVLVVILIIVIVYFFGIRRRVSYA